MRTRDFHIIALTVAVLSIAFLGATPAEAEERSMVVRASGLHLSPDVSYETTNDDGNQVTVRSASDTGWGIDFELMATSRLGIAVRYAQAEPDIRISLESGIENLDLSLRAPLGVDIYSAGLNFHLTPGRPVDLYVSPTVAYLSFDRFGYELELPDGRIETLNVDVKHDWAWGIGAGVDIPLGDTGWLATASASYLDSKLRVSEEGEDDWESLSFDPFILTAGIGYRF